jgi:Holliday junction resolvase RusA-like endonuclease
MNEAVSFSVFGTLPGLNEYVEANRRNRQQGARMKRSAETLIMQYVRVARLEPFVGPVILSFAWHERDRRRDCDNIAFAKKFILDALVKTRILTDDGRQYVVGFSDEFHVDPANPRVVITIERTSA